MNESFNNSTDAITHDSDPRCLAFQLVNVSDQYNEAGVVDIGTLVDLSRAVTPGDTNPPVMGVHIADLTGGAGNRVTYTLNGPDLIPITFSQLSGGLGVIELTWVEQPQFFVYVNASDIVALAAAQGLSLASTGRIDISSLIPVESGFAGLTISSIVWTPSVDWISSFGPLYQTNGMWGAGTNVRVGVNTEGSVYTSLLATPVGENTSVTGLSVVPQEASPLYLDMTLNGPLIPSVYTVDIPIDAPAIVAAASPTQLAASSGDVQLDATPFADYLDGTYSVVGYDIHWDSGYGPSIAASAPGTYLLNILNTGTYATTIGIPNTAIGTPSEDSGGGPYVLSTGTAPVMRLYLLPTDAEPTLKPVLMTAPYELRNRNLPAFKFLCSPQNQSDESSRLFDVVTLVSQGPFDGKDWLVNPSIEENLLQWTPTKVAIVDGATDVNTANINANNYITNMPVNYGNGSMLILDKNHSGPWNYIRFLIEPHLVEGNPVDLTGYRLRIIANAREL